MNKKLLREYVSFILNENEEIATDDIVDMDDDQYQKPKSNRAEKILFKKTFLSSYDKFKKMGSRGDGEKEVRLGLKDSTQSVTEEEIVSLVNDLGYTVEKEILPGEQNSKTSKYKTWQISRNNSLPFFVVFGSANKGEKFEAALHKDLQAGVGELGDELLASLGYTRDEIISVDPPLPSRGRPLTGEINDAGEAISDITLNVKTEKGQSKQVYVSLKDPNGGTFANNGYSGSFELTKKGFKPVSHDLDSFTDALGINKEIFAQGLNDYISQTQSAEEQCKAKEVNPSSEQKETIKNYIGSGFGFNYVYARKNRGQGYHIKFINTPEDVKKLVGNPINITVSYPRYCGDSRNDSSKGATAKIYMDNGAEYHVALKNSSGKILPNKCQISIKKYPSNELKESSSISLLRILIRENVR
jgi:hypothetical protein